jgi:hypothetical protein
MAKHKPKSEDQQPDEQPLNDKVSADSEPQVEPEVDIATQAKAVLEHNNHGTYTIPASGLYTDQWLWDSCFIAIGLRHYDVERAKIEILSLLRGQWSNGMLPHMILNPNSVNTFNKHLRNNKIWRSWINPMAPEDVSTSGITQPPVVAEAVVRIGEKLPWPERRSWYKIVYEPLLAYHEWLYRERDPHNEGLVLQIHPWETGLDNTPPWMAQLHEHLLPWWIRAIRVTRLDIAIGWFRNDTHYVPIEQRESTIEGLAAYDMQRRFRRKGYDFYKIIDHALMAIEDLTFNSIFIRANTQLRHIARSIRTDLPQELLENMKKTEESLEQLWDPFSSEYFSRDFVTHHFLKESSIAALMPLYAGCIDQKRAEILVRALENAHRFGPAFPVPSVPLDSVWYNGKTYWQGPTWINMNWMIIDGLKRYGFKDHAAALRESTLELITKSGFYEYFDPVTGEPAGAPMFSWTAALTIDLFQRK